MNPAAAITHASLFGRPARPHEPPAQMLPGETMGQYRAMGLDERDRRQSERWAAEQVAPFPLSWIQRLLAKWREAWGRQPDERVPEPKRAANLDMLARSRKIGQAHQAGIRADANDGDIVQEAAESARDMARRLRHREVITPAEWPQGVRLLALWAEALDWLEARGLVDFRKVLGPIAGVLKRVVCERWWRRILRRVHAQAVEATARAIGLVSKRAGCYVSDDGAKARAGQIARNQRAMESVIAVNDRGQDFTLAELAAKGPANREIRRHELMTRIAGFEVIARECQHDALFITVTCPGRMHAIRTRGHDVEPNPRFDGTTPDVAQQHLARQWARFRAACERWGVTIYGFRIAEPNHDGTPHWHGLLFMPREVGPGTVKANPRAGRPCAHRVCIRLLRRYFWRDVDQAEKGARRHRVKVERIDWARGSAAGYVAKYVAKNIDGYRVEKDLYGNDAMTSSQRVDAWASRWRVRQFQQIGGAPVGIWRELRRLHPDQAAAAPAIALAIDAANVASQADDIDECHDIARTETAAHGWASYLELQGGPRVRRADLRVRLLMEQSGELGRYGDPVAPRPAGVVTVDVRTEEIPPLGIVLRPMRRRIAVEVQAESERCTWVTVARDAVAAVRDAMLGKQEGPGAAGHVPPWSPVNNCTRAAGVMDLHPAPLFAPRVRRARKVGRWHQWREERRCRPGAAAGLPEPAMPPGSDDASSYVVQDEGSYAVPGW